MAGLTRSEWDDLCTAATLRLIHKGWRAERALREAGAITEARYGPRPPGEPGVGLKEKVAGVIVRAVAGGQMDKVKTFVNRYMVLFSVFYVALNFALDIFVQSGAAWATFAKTAVATVFGLLSVAPDPATATAVVGVGTAAVALYGAIRKVVSIITAPKE